MTRSQHWGAIGTLALALGVAAQAVQAQSASSPAVASSPAKKELAQKLVTLQQSAIEGMVRNLVEAPARQMMAAAEPALQTRVPPEQREATVKQVQEEVRKYVDSAMPIVRERAGKLAQTTLLPALEEKFTEDELRQIVTFYESPANKKLQQTMPEISKDMAQKLVADSRPQIEPKIKTLEASVAKSLGIPASGAGPAAKPAPAGSGLKPAPTTKGKAASQP